MDFDLQTEKELLELCKKDVRNFKKIYESNVDRLYSYCLSRCNFNEDRAMDIVSETFTKAIENIEKYTFTGRPFIAWLYTIAHNLIIDSVKSKGYGNLSIDELEYEVKEESESFIDKLGHEELKDKLKTALGELDEGLKEIIILKNDQDLTFAQIADIVGENEGTIKMRYYRSLGLIKNKLTEYEGIMYKTLKTILMFIWI